MTDLLFESLWFQSSDSTKADPIAQIFCLDAQRFDSLGLLVTETRIILGVLFPELLGTSRWWWYRLLNQYNRKLVALIAAFFKNIQEMSGH
jgi:hypothetical protein